MKIIKEDEIGPIEEISMEELIERMKGCFLNPRSIVRNLLMANCTVQIGSYRYRAI